MLSFIKDEIIEDSLFLYPCGVFDLQQEMCSNFHVNMFNWTIIGCIVENHKKSLAILCQQKALYYLNKSKEEGEKEIKDNDNIDKVIVLLKEYVKKLAKDIRYIDNNKYFMESNLNGKTRMVGTYKTIQNILEAYKGEKILDFINFQILVNTVEFVKSKIIIKKERVKRKN